MAAKVISRLLFAALLLTGLAACSQNIETGGISLDGRKTLGAEYPVNPAQPLHRRTASIPDSVLEAWRKMDMTINPQAEQYEAYALSDTQKQQLAQAIATLPRPWQKIMRQKLSRFFFIKNLLGGGITDWIIAADGRLTYTMILNPALFDATASEWLKMRESGSFETGDYRLQISGLQNVSALQFILWHEVAHLIDYENRYTSIADPLMRSYLDLKSNGTTPFMHNVWQSGNQPTFDFPARNKLNPYHMNARQPRIANPELPSTFISWQQTPFVTLYAASSPAEDFADFAAFHIARKRSGHEPVWQLVKKEHIVAKYAPLTHPANRARWSKLEGVAALR